MASPPVETWRYTGYGFDVSGVGAMKAQNFQDYMSRQNAGNLKKMRSFGFTK